MKRISCIILAFVLLLPVAFAQSETEPHMDWDQEYFEQLNSIEAKINYLKQVIEPRLNDYTNYDQIRQLQDQWEALDSEGSLAWFKQQMEENPNAGTVYLYGRLVEEPSEQIKYARRAVSMDPEFTYGYRLLVVPYMNNLFNGKEGTDQYETLARMFDRDYDLLRQAADNSDNPELWGFLYQAQTYKQDYEALLQTLEMGEELQADWVSPQRWAVAHAGTGDYEKAREVISNFADAQVEAGKYIPSEREMVFLYYYTSALEQTDSYAEAIRFLSSYDNEELRADARVDLAATYMKTGEQEKALKALRQAVKYGYDTPSSLNRYDEFDPLKGSDEWVSIISDIKQNRVESEPERRREALAEKMDLDAPELTMIDTSGVEVSLADLQDKVVVIDFWATWCGPCRMAMPEIDEFTRKFADRNVEVISLNVWEDAAEKANQFMIENDYSMTLMWAVGDAEPTDLFEVRGIPTLVVIGPDGKIRFKEVGYEEGLSEKLEWFANHLLEE